MVKVLIVSGRWEVGGGFIRFMSPHLSIINGFSSELNANKMKYKLKFAYAHAVVYRLIYRHDIVNIFNSFDLQSKADS